MDFYTGSSSNSSLSSSRLSNSQVGSTLGASSEGADTMTEARKYVLAETFGGGNDDIATMCSSASTAPSSTMSHPKITPETVQRAAAALNIPWTKSLEDAVLARSLLTSLPLTSTSARAGTAGSTLESGSSLGSSCALDLSRTMISSALDNPTLSGLQTPTNECPTPTTSTTLTTGSTGNDLAHKMIPKQDASINVGFYPSDHEMDNSGSSHSMPTSPIGSTSAQTSPTMSSLSLFIERDYASMGTSMFGSSSSSMTMSLSPPLPSSSSSPSSPSPSPSLSSISLAETSMGLQPPYSSHPIHQHHHPHSLHHPHQARLSILRSTQTKLPISSTKSIQATTYKSSYRTTSIAGSRRGDWRHSTGNITHPGPSQVSHRDGQSETGEEPPSVLDGRDISEMDEQSLKRAKNTDAARRSRHKKQMRMDGLEQRVSELEVENAMFESKLNEVELERSILADKNQTQQTRIRELELMVVALRDQILTLQSSRS